MKEFIEKLIERLEEEKFDCIVAKNYVPEVVELSFVKEIVKELAEEYNGGCERELADSKMKLYYTECGNAHIFAYGNPTENDYKFCPYCGKKIKVVY